MSRNIQKTVGRETRLGWDILNFEKVSISGAIVDALEGTCHN